MVGKRPAGFGKASKQKKQKPTEEEAELNIDLDLGLDDEELEEVYGLHSKLQQNRDPKVARGLVHECDQLLRSRDEKGETLPPRFHAVYGGALLTLADPQTNKEHKEFRDAGVERINIGCKSNDTEAIGVAAQELIQYVHTQIDPESGELNKAGRKLLDHSISMLKKRTSKQDKEFARAANQLLSLADELGDESEAMSTAFKVLETQIASEVDEIKALGHKGLGQYYMTLAAPALDALDDETDESNEKADTQLKQDLDKAISHIRKSVNDVDQESHVMLAEALLQWADIIEDEKEKKEANSEALKHLKKARLLGNDGLTDVIESIENPEEDD